MHGAGVCTLLSVTQALSSASVSQNHQVCVVLAWEATVYLIYLYLAIYHYLLCVVWK